MRRLSRYLLVLLLLFPAACIKAPPVEKPPPARAVGWDELPGWQADEPQPAFAAFMLGCPALKWRSGWEDACRAAEQVDPDDPQAVRAYFELWFQPWQLQQEDGTPEGLLTGYYVPELPASRSADERFRYPLYAVPDDLLVVDLSSVYPELENYRLRGRLDGQRVIPYFDRAAIAAGEAGLDGKVLFWLDDPVELFFLQIQGSGRLLLRDGSKVMVNYAEQNGHPYRSIGRLLLERGAMTREQMSLQNIRQWALDHPELVDQLLNENPSYVFFRVLPHEVQSPPGAMGLSLTPERSLAVDKRYIPLGSPVYLAAQWPGSDRPLQRLMVAQDTGGAIKGRVRADFFWGLGDQAGELAGRTKQPLRLWLLLPRGVEPPPVPPSVSP